jgi:hypothetical protein
MQRRVHGRPAPAEGRNPGNPGSLVSHECLQETMP